MAHEGAPNNPQDHKHSDYETAWGGVGLAMVIGILGLVLGFGLSCQVERVEDRIEQQEERLCELSDYPAACLADLLEERR